MPTGEGSGAHWLANIGRVGSAVLSALRAVGWIVMILMLGLSSYSLDRGIASWTRRLFIN